MEHTYYLFEHLLQLLFLFKKLVDAAEVLTHLALAKLVNLCGKSVEEVTVVAYKYQSTVIIGQCLL